MHVGINEAGEKVGALRGVLFVNRRDAAVPDHQRAGEDPLVADVYDIAGDG
ncbi:MAG: hypothetical protein BWY76_02866 [bacterium ADurb.Bin429]|nr:MAG: hypothetical protein BWY76_02866 [bacterium ADurb.Bin429]